VTDSWWFLSFAGGEGHRGGLILKGADELDALARATSEGLNPGGEVLFVRMDPPWKLEAAVPEGYRGRLLSRTDLIELDILAGGDGTLGQI
jgi:hypothetical protein